jgi:WD40 repeat protein
MAWMVLLMDAKTEAWKVESLGTPCRARQVLAGRAVRDRQTGQELFVLTNMNETSRAELIFIDPEKGTATVSRAPAGSGSWALKEVSRDRLVVGTFYDGQFMVYDLQKREWVKTAGVPGETYIWNLAQGSDGRIYGGTYGNGKLAAFDLNTYAVEDLGAPAPPNLYLRLVSATPDGRILCSFGTEKPTTLLFDPKTKQFSSVPKSIEGIALGGVWEGYFVAGTQAFQGTQLADVSPLPFPTPPADKGGWYIDTTLTTERTLYLRQGNRIYRYKKGMESLVLLAEQDLRGGILYAATEAGVLLGVRGQDYFVLKSPQTKMKMNYIPGDSSPRKIHFLKADGAGRLWGGPPFGQTLFSLNLRSKRAQNTATVSDAGGEVYDATFVAGKVYAAAYSAGDIIRYDPKQKWDQWGKSNPKTLVSLNTRGYIRPTAGIVASADGKTLYSGWTAAYGNYGGALATTQTESGATDLIENPLGEQALEGLAVLGNFAYIGTSLSANGLPKKSGESARFGVIDLTTKQVVFRHEFEGVESVRQFVLEGKTGVVGGIASGTLFLYDTSTRTFLKERQTEPIRATSYTMAAPGDGHIYFGQDKVLLRYNVTTGIVTKLAVLPERIHAVTSDAKSTLFVSCDAEVFRISAR